MGSDSAATAKSQNKSKKKVQEVADSWEDESVGSSPDPSDNESGKIKQKTKSTTDSNDTKAPKEDAAVDDVSNLLSSHSPFYSTTQSGSSRDGIRSERRPEKTVATANRMIGAALGVRIRPTDEQKQFQKAQIENEKKRREKEKEKKLEDEKKKLEDEKAKQSIWED